MYYDIKETKICRKKSRIVQTSSDLSFMYRRALRSRARTKGGGQTAANRRQRGKGTFFFFRFSRTDRIEINRPYVEPVRASRECVTACAHDRRAPVIGGRGGGGRGWILFSSLSFGGTRNCEQFRSAPLAGGNVSPDVLHMPSAVSQRRRSVQLSDPLSRC